jgi:integrase
MPRTKSSRNPLGSILKKQIKIGGKNKTVFLARKRYFDEEKQKYCDRTRRCATYAEATVALLNLQKEIEAEAQAKKENQKARNLFELLDYYKKEHIKPAVFAADGRQISGYRQDTKTLETYIEEIKEYFKDVPLRAITYEHLRAFREHVATKKIVSRAKHKRPTARLPAAATVNRKLSFLRRILSVGVQLQWININPFALGERLIRPAEERPRNRMLTFAEEAALLAAADAPVRYEYERKNKKISAERKNTRAYLKIWIIAAVDTAMRRGDLYNLKWKQIDFENKVIHIPPDKRVSKTGKAGILPLTARLAAELENLKQIRFDGKPKPNEAVLGRVNFKNAFRRLCADAQVPDFQFRDLRSTGATRMLLAGNPSAIVQKVTRHSREEIFLDHYTNVDVQNARAVGEKLSGFIESQQRKIENPPLEVPTSQ